MEGDGEAGPPRPRARSYLHARLREPQALAQLLAHEGVGVVRLVKEPLQLVELLQREVGAAAPLLQLRLPVLVLGLDVLALLLAIVQTCGRAEGTALRPSPGSLHHPGPLADGSRTHTCAHGAGWRVLFARALVETEAAPWWKPKGPWHTRSAPGRKVQVDKKKQLQGEDALVWNQLRPHLQMVP